ncbi:MAG: LptF/LptG family permease [Verrucomicrobiota bacterium]
MKDQFNNKIAEYQKRKFSGILFRYISVHYIVPLGCCLAGFCVLFFIADVFDDLESFLEARAAPGAIMKYFLMRQPINLVHVLPMSILLSLSFMMSVLVRHGELTAIRSAGISLIHCCTPVWIISILGAGCLFWLNEAVVPVFEEKSQYLEEKLKGGEPDMLKDEELLAFRYGKADRDWLFERFRKNAPHSGVAVKQFSNDKRKHIDWEIRADEAVYKEGTWIFKDAKKWEYDQGESLPSIDRTGSVEKIEIDDFSETPDEMLNTLKPVDKLSTFEMLRILRQQPDLPAATKQVFSTTLWYRLGLPLSCLLAACLGVGLTSTENRTSTLKGFAVALALMVVYYVTSQFLVVLGKNGLLPPVAGGLATPAAFLAYGLRTVYKRR